MKLPTKKPTDAYHTSFEMNRAAKTTPKHTTITEIVDIWFFPKTGSTSELKSITSKKSTPVAIVSITISIFSSFMKYIVEPTTRTRRMNPTVNITRRPFQ
jgi:hypothetical protein